MKQFADFIPIVLFFVVFKLYDDVQQGVMAATAVLVVATLVQLAWSYYRHRRVEKLPLLAALLAVLFGGITLLLQDEIYIKWKPTVVNWLFGLVFLGSQFIGSKPLVRRMMESQIQVPDFVWTRLNMAWSLFFIGMGFLNLYVVYYFDTDTWVNFKFYGLIGLTIIFVFAQGFYLVRYIQDEEPRKEIPEEKTES